MPSLPPPDALFSLHPDRHAPRAARHCVGNVDRPSPDLRDVVMLLTSELVTRAVMLCASASEELVELRIWMPAEVVRVELRAARALVCAPVDQDNPPDGLVLVDELADRWSIDACERDACIWFEIDRHYEPSRHDQPTRTDHPFAFAPRL